MRIIYVIISWTIIFVCFWRLFLTPPKITRESSQTWPFHCLKRPQKVASENDTSQGYSRERQRGVQNVLFPRGVHIVLQIPPSKRPKCQRIFPCCPLQGARSGQFFEFLFVLGTSPSSQPSQEVEQAQDKPKRSNKSPLFPASHLWRWHPVRRVCKWFREGIP